MLPLKTNKQTNKQKTHPRAKEKSQQDDRRDEFMFRIKPHKCQRYLEGSEKTLLTPGLTRDCTDIENKLVVPVGRGK